ncbi:MAG: NAD-dependent epimerase/dehydratase family protein [Deltaproteobacteria bacterium]|nr:NAD-dependent epimerase/dehydratase family protein [Deltaproteobacteria bacterium]
MSVIVLTGIAGTLGRLLARQLHLDHEVIGLDRRDLPDRPKDIRVYTLDIRRKRCESLFRRHKVNAVVHLNIMHDFRRPQAELHAFNVLGTQRLLEYAARHGVRKFVFLSTANVYGARPDNPQFLTEEALLLAGEGFSEMRSLVSADMLVTSFFWKTPQVETVILRPAHILGTATNGPSAYLSLPCIPTVLGFDPMIQVMHESEVVGAIVAALAPGRRGVYNLAGPPAAPLSALAKYLGKRTLPLPYSVLRALAQRAWQMGVAEVPPPELDFLRFPCLVDDARARRELGFEPRLTLPQTLDLLRKSPTFRRSVR